jgi:hypothetical protein
MWGSSLVWGDSHITIRCCSVGSDPARPIRDLPPKPVQTERCTIDTQACVPPDLHSSCHVDFSSQLDCSVEVSRQLDF